jgi:UPF0755 protein
MKRIMSWLAVSAFVLIIAGAGVGYWFWSDMQRVLDQKISLLSPGQLFEIKRGTPLANIAGQLEEMGWLERAQYFRLEARRLQVATQLQAGTYEIPDNSTPRQLLGQFVRGDVKVFQVTLIEGSTFGEVREVLSANTKLRATIADRSAGWVAAQLAPELEDIEGRLFPSTYHFSNGDSDMTIIRRAYARMNDLLAAHWETRAPNLPYSDPVEALIMASIIEKETGQGGEREQISGVFVRRLKRGMKLQTDPTVIYGLGEEFDGNLRRVDLQTDTIYNTYTRHGLPPTPIAMPGEASIKAALHPAEGNSIYFVGRGDGTHQFSKRLNEHNAAVRRYQSPGRRNTP